jgi:general stress protein 26
LPALDLAEDGELLAVQRRTRLFDLTRRFRTGSLVTRSPEGLVRARPMTLALLDASTEELGFLTSIDSDVLRDTAAEPMVGIVFQDARHHVAWSGRAYVDHERYRVTRAWQPELSRWFPDGPDDPRVVLLVVRAIRAEYWSASVVSGALRALGAAVASHDAVELEPARHGVVLFEDEGALTEW